MQFLSNVTEGDTYTGGQFSHSEGSQSVANGMSSHVEGYYNTTNGDYSHAEGYKAESNGISSHAEGSYANAYGNSSHVEGNNCNVFGDFGHAEGNGCNIASDMTCGHSEGYYCWVKADHGAHAEGYSTTASGAYGSHSEGNGSIAAGQSSHAEGYQSTANKTASHAEGNGTVVNGDCGHAEGYNTAVNATASHAEGNLTNAFGVNSHAEGQGCQTHGDCSHSEGQGCQSNGWCSHAEGFYTKAIGVASHAGGYTTTSDVYESYVIGQYNKTLTGNQSSYSGTADAFVIGNGSTSSLGNAFRVTFNGKTYGLSAFNSTGADYAEYFEWLDDNTTNEDRVGYFVTLDGEKIRKATSADNYILGVVSVNPSVIGDSYSDDWSNKYITDKWGRIQYEYVTVPKQDDIPEHVDYIPKINPAWDSTQTYIPRENRPEWSAVGFMGKLLVRDDGTCEVNGYCKSNDNGIATKSDSGYRVVKRIDENTIKIVIN